MSTVAEGRFFALVGEQLETELEERGREALSLDANRWEGWDIRFASGRTLRVSPIDGEWDAGIEVHVLTHNGVCLRTMTCHGVFTGSFIAEVAMLFAEKGEDR